MLSLQFQLAIVRPFIVANLKAIAYHRSLASNQLATTTLAKNNQLQKLQEALSFAASFDDPHEEEHRPSLFLLHLLAHKDAPDLERHHRNPTLIYPICSHLHGRPLPFQRLFPPLRPPCLQQHVQNRAVRTPHLRKVARIISGSVRQSCRFRGPANAMARTTMRAKKDQTRGESVLYGRIGRVRSCSSWVYVFYKGA